MTEQHFKTLAYLLVGILVFWFVRLYCPYDYAYAEQMRMFRYSWDYALPLLTTAGGPATFVADYLTQFYYYPMAAALINVGFFAAVALLVEGIAQKTYNGYLIPALATLAGIYMLILETDLSHQMEDTLSAILILFFTWLILCSRRWLWLSVTVYVVAVATLYYFHHSFLIMLISGLVAMLAYQVQQRFELKFVHIRKDVIRYTVTGATCVAALWLGANVFTLMHHPQSTRLKVLEVMRWNQNWDGILALPFMQVCPTPLYAAYQNLALAEKGKLGEEFDKYPQMGLLGLCYDNHGLQHETMLLSDVCMIQGNISTAQMMAFNSLISEDHWTNPHLIIRLVETNLIDGADKVAEKYITLLEETKFYREKGSSYRRFLNNPEAVMQDPVLGPLKRVKDNLSGNASNIYSDLEHIVAANPDYKPAKDYWNCYLKLSLNESK